MSEMKAKSSSYESFQGDRKRNLELDIANAKYRESEASNQSLKIQLENFERKVVPLTFKFVCFATSYIKICLFVFTNSISAVM